MKNKIEQTQFPFLRQLKRAFRPRIFHLIEKVQLVRKGWRRGEWLLGRGLCRYGCFSLSGVPRSQRRNALMLQLREWAPFVDTDYHVVFKDRYAMVWGWDRGGVDAARASIGRQQESDVVIPESLMYSPKVSGLRLIQLLEGVEGQFWREGLLLNSRWWPDCPGHDEWLSFQRESRIPHAEQKPLLPVEKAPLLLSPWITGFGTQALHYRAVLNEFMVYALMFFGLFLLTAWYGLQFIQYSGGVLDKQAELQKIEQKAHPILAAREHALSNLETINSIVRLQSMPSQLILMEEVAKTLPGNGEFIREWQYREGRVKLSIYSPEKNIVKADLAERLENNPRFAKVQALMNPDPKIAIFDMEVLPLHAPFREPVNE